MGYLRNIYIWGKYWGKPGSINRKNLDNYSLLENWNGLVYITNIFLKIGW